MARSIRKWWICLLVAMLPLQGIAAATMAMCDPAHHAQPAAAATGHDDAARHTQAYVHDHAQGHTQGHTPGQAEGYEPAQTGEVVSSDSGPTAVGAGDSHKCSACASCCGVGVLPAVPSFESAAPGPATFAALASKVEPFATVVAERPPRRSRA